MQYGLQEGLEDLREYILGASPVPYVPYNESGNWELVLPRYENQTTKHGQETSGCTVWAALNQIETLHMLLFAFEVNYSERFTYLNVPIDPSKGTDPQNTYEAIREHGLVEEEELPITDTLLEYLDSSDITGSLRAKGQNWLRRHDFRHEWLWKTRPANYIDILKDALKTSPIMVSVSAWNLVGDEYVSYGNVNNHACLLYKIDEDGHPWIFDSYDHSKKKLSKDHNIRRAKRIWLNRRTKPSMRKHVGLLQAIINRLMSKPTLLEVIEGHLGTDASPRDTAPDELACAETVTTILQKFYPGIPVITGTWTLNEWLKVNWKQIDDPVPGCVVISPTGIGKGAGHTGFALEDGVIASNDSRTGKFMKNYTVDVWRAQYGKRGFPTLFYTHV